ncbi:MAG: hypothetical protein R8N23_12255 [Reichenbachiella sp.]|uniref:matrixin family metalloprotease n=1 Tax=Reichenbachiella sp. TaxID=2184521 RepID=UPI0029666DED|nr:matrixin family metalloprotease [Reichenbachiella sp.]MDW3210638.1 hypothetical protein [Reichenbachiella sp.]
MKTIISTYILMFAFTACTSQVVNDQTLVPAAKAKRLFDIAENKTVISSLESYSTGDNFGSNVENASNFMTFVNKDAESYRGATLKSLITTNPAEVEDLSIKSLLEVYDTVMVDKVMYFVAEGDLLFDYDEMIQYVSSVNFYNKDTLFQQEKLVGVVIGGQFSKIHNPENISYSIIKQTFSEAEYNNLIAYMSEATEDWSRICNVAFTHRSDLDDQLNASDNPQELTFVIKKVNSGTFIAKAFFPYYPKYRRKILIDFTFFTSDFSKPGVLRHELGHVLGFRHEHIRSGAPAICPSENMNNTIELSDYDPKSVMHYFCGGVGSKDLKITKKDSIGASIFYPFN